MEIYKTLILLFHLLALSQTYSLTDFFKKDNQTEDKPSLPLLSNGVLETFLEKMASLIPTSAGYFGFPKISDDCLLRKDFKGPDIFQFTPVLKGILKHSNQTIHFSSNCFALNTVTITHLSNDTITLHFNAHNARSYLCKDSYLLSTSRILSLKIIFFKGERDITLSHLTQDDLLDIQVNGLRLFAFCNDIVSNIMSLYSTYEYVISDFQDDSKKKPVEERQKANVEFLTRHANMTMEDRGKYADIPILVEDEIQSGDFIGVTTIDSAFCSMIMYLTGSRLSHAAVALRLKDNELYIAEMVWKGIFVTPYKDWIAEKKLTGRGVMHLPLREDYRKMFNTTNAYEFIQSKKHLPYANFNLYFSWLDVPQGNLPDFTSTEILLLFMSVIEKYNRHATDISLIVGLNQRLGTENLTTHQVAVEAAKRNMTFEELLSIPEDDNWRYTNGQNYACSAFAMDIYIHGGLFSNVSIFAQEFTPRDIYHLDIFDKEFKHKRPQVCKDADPSLDYCQMLGRYRINIFDYGTVKPYDRMNERCPSTAPRYERPEGC